jgi:hypothetical protein
MLARSEELREIRDEHNTCRAAIARWCETKRTGHDRVEESDAPSRDLATAIARLIWVQPEAPP